MITAINEHNPVQSTFYGLSTDAKPAACGNGSCFVEMDSGKLYFYDADTPQWIEWGAAE